MFLFWFNLILNNWKDLDCDELDVIKLLNRFELKTFNNLFYNIL